MRVLFVEHSQKQTKKQPTNKSNKQTKKNEKSKRSIQQTTSLFSCTSLANREGLRIFLMYSFFPLTLLLCPVLLHMHLLNSIEEGLVIILPSNNPVCPPETFTRIWLPLILGAGRVQTGGRRGEKTRMPLKQIPPIASRSNWTETDVSVTVNIPNCTPRCTANHVIKKERQHWSASFPYIRWGHGSFFLTNIGRSMFSSFLLCFHERWGRI